MLSTAHTTSSPWKKINKLSFSSTMHWNRWLKVSRGPPRTHAKFCLSQIRKKELPSNFGWRGRAGLRDWSQHTSHQNTLVCLGKSSRQTTDLRFWWKKIWWLSKGHDTKQCTQLQELLMEAFTRRKVVPDVQRSRTAKSKKGWTTST